MKQKAALWALVLLFIAGISSAAISKEDKKAAKKLLEGTLYFRIDAPCGLGRHPFGTYKFPLVEVSPTGSNTQSGEGLSAGPFHAQSIYWGVGPNDSVKFDSIKYYDEENAAELEVAGVGKSDGNDTVIKLVNILTLDDFKKAIDQAFSHVPLQEEHADWSADVKKAIADRKLMNGMTKRQVFYVTGSPESVKESEEKGKKVETWSMRQDRGAKIGFWTFSAGEKTGLPNNLRFEDGKLVGAEQATSPGGLKLDN